MLLKSQLILSLANLSHWKLKVKLSVGCSILYSVQIQWQIHVFYASIQATFCRSSKVVLYTIWNTSTQISTEVINFFPFFFYVADIFVLQRDFTLKWERAYITISHTHIRVCYGK